MQYSYTKLTVQAAYMYVVIYCNYYFIANSTSYLNAPGFEVVSFNCCNITDASIEGRRVAGDGVGGGNWLIAEGKTNKHSDINSSAMPSVGDLDKNN